MEDWLTAKGFREMCGIWYRWSGGMTTMYAYVDEDLNWSTGYNKGDNFTLPSNDNLLFSCLPEDQAKESIENLINL